MGRPLVATFRAWAKAPSIKFMALTTEQSARLLRLLDEVLDLDEPARRRWIEELAPTNDDLRPALRQSLLGGAAIDLTLPKVLMEPAFNAGEQVGPYELIRPLGAGGMAQVWLARRADGAFKREVALKLPSALTLRGDLAARFEREKNILATLEHPNIARLYDAGVSQQGLPYLAMEYVDGRPIDAWCDRQRSKVKERVTLFLQVLEAVEYANRRGVLHRDIKPSNVLVTEEGQVRLLDFGVARLLEHRDTKLTQVYGKALTPAYASPEQMGDEELGPASDIYSLGVLLYELLSGTLPQKAATQGEDGTPVPSTRIDAQAAQARSATLTQVARQLSGELDAVVMKALAADPKLRYATAGDLARDLKAYLEVRPIQALPASTPRRLSKFIRREPISAVAIVAVLAAIGLGLAVLHRAAPTSAAANVGAAAVNEKSVAVLAFSDMSEKHDQEFFSDGLAAELLDLLARMPGLHVTARTSSFYFKGKQVTVEQIGSALHVANVLEGSVRRSGNRLRVTTELIRCSDAEHLWSHTFEGTIDDVFKMQDEIANTVASVIKVELGARRRPTPYRSVEKEAHLQYLLGIQYFNQNTEEGYRRGINAFKKAISIDPGYGVAFAGLSKSEWYLADYTNDVPGKKMAAEHANRAIEIDPQEAEAYSARAAILGYDQWQWKAGLADADKAIELNPENANAIMGRAIIDLAVGRVSEAIVDSQKATDLDPFNVNSWQVYAQTLAAGGRFAQARRAYERGLAIDLQNPIVLFNFAILELLEHRFTEAKGKCRDLDRDELYQLTCESMAQYSLGQESDSRAALGKLESQHAANAAYQIAGVHCWRNEHALAFKWLDRAVSQRDGGLALLASDPLFRKLHADPRFKQLLHTINVLP
jgi:serine/threonine protein kinase